MESPDKSTSVSTIGDVMAEDDHRAKRTLVQGAAGGLITIGLLFTGFLNFMLYSRPFPSEMKIVGVIPALLIEGSLAVFLLGSFVWFAHGVQSVLAKIFGWLMFLVVGLNAVVEFNSMSGADMGEFLQVYAFWGIPLVVVMTIAFWKAVVDADPSIQRMRRRRKIRLSIEEARDLAFVQALNSDSTQAAVIDNGEMQAGEVQRWLRGQAPRKAELPAGTPSPIGIPAKAEAKYSTNEILAAIPEQYREAAKGFMANLPGQQQPTQPASRRRPRRGNLRLAKDRPSDGPQRMNALKAAILEELRMAKDRPSDGPGNKFTIDYPAEQARKDAAEARRLRRESEGNGGPKA
ncbi:MAG: hypothetical protein M1546_00370 [Chloroflexi bacterium]|nr:hypothetical protein [Chloroflexota bacterium]